MTKDSFCGDHSGHRKRLRERYAKAGIVSFSDHEILELALTYSIPRGDVKPAAKRLLARYGSLACVLSADPAHLRAIKGIGKCTASFFVFLRDLSALMVRSSMQTADALSSPRMVVDYLRTLLKGIAHEEFHAVYLDSGNRVNGTTRLQSGTVNRSAVFPRQVAEGLLRHGASGVIIAHNHPGGSLTPSDDDLRATAAVRAAVTPLDASLIDHIIVTAGGYVSFREQGLL